MKRNTWMWKCLVGALLVPALAVSAWGAVLGKVVPIGGNASDIALDEARGVLYIANFTANRIDVMSLSDFSIQSSINVAAQPSSCTVSPDGRYLVVTHFGNFKAPASQNNSLTIVDLVTHGKQTFALSAPALGAEFGINGLALVVTTQGFSVLNPVSGMMTLIATIPELAAESMPVPPATFPPNIVAASMNVSGDGTMIYGLTDTFEFGFNVANNRLGIISYVSEPEQGPRVVSVNHDGSKYLAGWVLHGTAIWNLGVGVWNLAQFPDAEGILNVGSHAIDSAKGLVYAQVKTAGEEDTQVLDAPVLQVLRDDNLQLLEQIQLPENLAGKSLLSSDGAIMYSVSDSGVLVLPVGNLDLLPRVVANSEQVHFESNFCDWQVLTQELFLYSPSGENIDFSLSTNTAGVTVTPSSGTTPAMITVRADPAAFQLSQGTAEDIITVTSSGAVNLPREVRVLVTTPAPDQRGTVVSVPGKLVDILPDPFRERFLILRQDTNEVLVFDSKSYQQIASLRTGNTPTQMAITFDRRRLLVGHDDSQFVSVFDLETLEEELKIRTPGGHYPRSVAASARAILTANRVAGPVHTIDRVDLATRRATELPSLGVWENDIDKDTVLVASPNGSSILAAQASGHVLLYNANVDSFTISRKDADSLSGAYAASSYDQFVAGDRLMNSSLVTTALLETGTGQPSGFAFVDDMGIRTTVPTSSDPGVIQRVDPQTGQGLRATRMAEGPLLRSEGCEDFGFTRTLAVLYSREMLVSLSTSGFTALPWNYDASVAPPRINAVVNAADYETSVAPGGLVSIFGEDLSPVNLASSQVPLPTALANSCLTVNGMPMPVLFVSPYQVNAQLPFNVDGNVTMVLRTPGGVSDNYNLTIRPNAPSVFLAWVSGLSGPVPIIVRHANNSLVTPSNPIHGDDYITIFLTGMGRTNPAIDAGVPAPSDPPAGTIVPTQVRLAGMDLPITYSGLAPGRVGVYQIDAQVPWWVPAGLQQTLEITQGGGSTSLLVRVVD